jgi:hypothetical protein
VRDLGYEPALNLLTSVEKELQIIMQDSASSDVKFKNAE